jgi:hypothetical protein
VTGRSYGKMLRRVFDSRLARVRTTAIRSDRVPSLALDGWQVVLVLAIVLIASALTAGCQPPPNPSPTGATATPVYNPRDGRLEQLVSDVDGNGTLDTRGYLDGRRLARIEIDRNDDGRPDRWEFYRDLNGTGPSPTPQPEIERVEEAEGPEERITRREFYEHGQLRRVEDDSNIDGRVDRWEHFENGLLARIELDLTGAGFPDRRLIYRRDGTIDRIEINPEGDGVWRALSPTS